MITLTDNTTERQIADTSPSAQQHNQGTNHSPLADGPSTFANEVGAAPPAAFQKII
jgi:hypothetical protein